jgi:hypothetical protein
MKLRFLLLYHSPYPGLLTGLLDKSNGYFNDKLGNKESIQQ